MKTESYKVLYHKLPFKKRNVHFDGIVHLVHLGSSFILKLVAEDGTELSRKSLPSSFNPKDIVGSSGYQIGQHIVDFEEQITLIETANECDSGQIAVTISACDNLKLPVKFHPPKQLYSRNYLQSNNQYDNDERSNEKVSNDVPSKENTDFNGITHLYCNDYRQMKKRDQSMRTTTSLGENALHDVDNFLRKVMRPHQIEAVEWIVNRLIFIQEDPKILNDRPISYDKQSFLDCLSDDDSTDAHDDGFILNKVPKTSFAKAHVKFDLVQTSAIDIQGVILADEMGLGKSLTALGVVWRFIRPNVSGKGISCGRGIVVCPSSLVANWEKEVKKWFGVRLCPICVRSSTKQSPRQSIERFQYSNNAALLIISYEMYRNHSELLNKTKNLEIIVCDEGHRLKNVDGTKTISSLSGSSAKRRLLLSGTPIQNDLDELFAMASFAKPNALGSLPHFQANFSGPISRGNDVNATYEEIESSKSAVERLRLILKDLVIRRTQADVLSKFLPPKYEHIVMCSLSSAQLLQYRSVAEGMFKALRIFSPETRPRLHDDPNGDYYFLPMDVPIDELEECAHPSKVIVLPTLMKLRQICNAGSDIANLSLQSSSCWNQNPILSRDHPKISSKLQILRILLSAIMIDTTEKAVVVSNFVSTLDLICRFIIGEGWDFYRLDGSTPLEQRQDFVELFNNTDEKRIFVLSSKAGGLGINLIGGSRLIMFDCDWNPAVDSQAMSRIWREGQKREVHVYRLVAKDVLEESILMRQRSKSILKLVMDQEDGSIDTLNEFNRMSITTSDIIDLVQPKYPSNMGPDDYDTDNVTKPKKRKRTEEEQEFNSVPGDAVLRALVDLEVQGLVHSFTTTRMEDLNANSEEK